MQKLTKEEFAAMTDQQLREWVEANCVQAKRGRPSKPDALSDAERARRYRQRQKE